MTERLPPLDDEQVVELQLGHVLRTIGVLAGTGVLVGLSLILARDYVRYRRQKNLLEAAIQIIQTIKEELPWSCETIESSSQATT